MNSPQPMVFRLAHVTDPHFQSFRGATFGDFLGKRAVGAVNLVLNRRRKHKMALLDALGRDLRARGFDHLAVTGDLSNVSLQGEWDAARAWIDGLQVPPDKVTVIPGNHDAYVPDVVTSGRFEAMFAPFQGGDNGPTEGVYPFVRLRGDQAIVGVNTCVPTGDLGAWGRIGDRQLERLESVLMDQRDRLRVLLIHHPPVVHRPPEHRNLRDRDALVALLARTGCGLVLHGHDHADERTTLPGPGGTQIPVVGAGSASYAGRPERRARYNVYEIAGRAITAVTYRHDETSDAFVEANRVSLTGPDLPGH